MGARQRGGIVERRHVYQCHAFSALVPGTAGTRINNALVPGSAFRTLAVMTNSTTAASPASNSFSDRSIPPVDENSGSGTTLAILVIAQFMALLDASIVNIAIPSIRDHLHASGAGLQLVVAGYTVAYAMLLITGARLGALIGHKRCSSRVSSRSAASLMCGVAPTTGVLIGSRVLQGNRRRSDGSANAEHHPKAFTGASRTRAFSVYGAALAIGGVTGQILGERARRPQHRSQRVAFGLLR